MKIKSQKDFWSGLVFVVLGIAFAWGATTYPMGDASAPGAGYFPFGLGLLLAVLGGLVLFTAVTIESPGGDRIQGVRLRPLVFLVLAIAGFGLTLERLGLVVSLPLLVLLSSLAGDEFRWKDVLATAVVLTAGSWLVFQVLLKLNLPMWPRFLVA